MEPLLRAFKEAFAAGQGYQLAATVSPVESLGGSGRLRAFVQSTNAVMVNKDVRKHILNDASSPFKFSTDEGTAWVEVYSAYWSAMVEVLKVEDAIAAKKTVSISIHLRGFLHR
jgi:glycerate kinase